MALLGQGHGQGGRQGRGAGQGRGWARTGQLLGLKRNEFELSKEELIELLDLKKIEFC